MRLVEIRIMVPSIRKVLENCLEIIFFKVLFIIKIQNLLFIFISPIGDIFTLPLFFYTFRETLGILFREEDGLIFFIPLYKHEKETGSVDLGKKAVMVIS